MNDYNIEFAHIYSNEEFGEEQATSVEIFNEVCKKFVKEKKKFVSCVLIDEFSSEVKTLDEKNYIKKIRGEARVDFVVHESSLIEIAEEVIAEIDSSKVIEERFGGRKVTLLDTEIGKIGLKDNSDKYTCALLIAAWHLVRLGFFELSEVKKQEREFSAKKILTILPKRYEENEKKVLEIIKATRFGKSLRDIEYRFF